MGLSENDTKLYKYSYTLLKWVTKCTERRAHYRGTFHMLDVA